MSNLEVMLDLETLDTGPNALICAIGAVAFNQVDIVDQFYRVIDITALGVEAPLGTISPATVAWWMKQSDEARVIFDRSVATCTQHLALVDFGNWIRALPVQKPSIWGNGVDFDNVILGNCFKAHHLPIPWHYAANRCFRTLKNEFQSLTPTFVGVKHNALADATHQAQHLMAIRRAIHARTG